MANSIILRLLTKWGEDWMVDAACSGLGPDLFYPNTNDDDKGTKERIRLAKKICDTCPVKTECLEYIMSKPSYNDDGIWGGTTTSERRHLRTALRRFNNAGRSGEE